MFGSEGGFSYLTTDEQLKCIQKMFESSSTLLSTDILRAAIQDTQPLSSYWTKLDADQTVMGVAMRFFLCETPPAGVYVWRNDEHLVTCHFDRSSSVYIMRNLGTSETFSVARQDCPDMLLTSGKVPGVQGNWTIFHYLPKEKQEEVQEEPKKIPAPEPVLKKAKTSSGSGKKKVLAVIEQTPVETTGGTSV